MPLLARILLLLAALLATPLLAAAQAVPGASGEEMQRAIATARRTLPQFWERVRANAPSETGYAVKIVASDQHGAEHVWLSRLRMRGGRIVGTIDTKPRIVRSLRQGQELPVNEDAIVDWMYFRNGLIVGNETGRAMLRALPREEAEKLLKLYE
ncbi:MAG: DUF2314 domain-containing protein [Alphaproteobacteria bacterium]|jgi:uncharacterized protein YegJ (DUF2314 family)